MSALGLVLRAVQAASAALPFEVGERFEYSAKWGIISAGKAAIEVVSIDTLRDNPAFRLRYTLDANAPLGLYRIVSTMDSWTSVAGLHSLRLRQENRENNRHFVRQFDVFPDSGFYRQVHPEPVDSQPTVAEPLDDASVLYFVRTIPLEVGRTYRFNRYFRAGRNPIVIKVEKRETMELPDGSKVSCLVLNPVVGERGLFGPRADARLWLTEDRRRIPVQIRSTYSFGTITLRLTRMVDGS